MLNLRANMKKSDILKTKSNPAVVSAKLKQLLGNDTKLYISTHKSKKYMVENPDGKWIHFGDINSEDYSYHADEKRRKAFQTRNAKWAKAEKWTPAWLSYYILW